MTAFTLAAAQVPSHVGDIERNVAIHARAATAAAGRGAALVVFPELSLTSYEPAIGATHAIEPGDARLAPLAEVARARGITIVAGAPFRNDGGKPFIGAVVLEPDGGRRAYRKMHLGSIESPFFAPGDTPLALDLADTRVGLAICADTGRPTHPQAYAALGAAVYAAGVMLTAEWYGADAPRLEAYARDLGLLSVMANHGASTGTYVSVGKSAIWAPGGALLARADGNEACLVLATRDGDAWRARVEPLDAA